MGRKTNRVLITTDEEISKINPDNIELLDDFLNYMEATDHSPSSIKVYKSNLRIFFVYLMKFCKNKDFVDIKKRDIMNFQNYLIKNKLSPARIRVLRSSISSLGIFIENILDEEEKYENFRNIVNKIPAPNMALVREKTVISDEELDNLVNELIKRNKIQIATFIIMCAYSGARKSEMIQYKRSYFTSDTLKGGLYVTPEIRTKGSGVLGKPLKKYCLKSKVDIYLEMWDKERDRLEINIDDLFVVRHDNEWRCATTSTITGWMHICEDILGKPCYCHSFRHFFVSSLRRSNVPMDVIRDIVGHNSTDVTEMYNDNPKEDTFMQYFTADGIKQIESTSISDL